jgi:hypothetical protein
LSPKKHFAKLVERDNESIEFLNSQTIRRHCYRIGRATQTSK